MSGLIRIGRGSEYINNLEEELRFYLDEACLYLNIPKPELRFLHFYESGEMDAGYSEASKIIFIGVCDQDVQVNLRSPRSSGLNSTREVILFALFHEVGHHWHNVTRKSHWLKFAKGYKSMNEIGYKEYVRQPLERVAEAVGAILFKQLFVNKVRGKNGRSELLSH